MQCSLSGCLQSEGGEDIARDTKEGIQEHLNAISKCSNTVEVRRNYLISCVTVPSAKIYTPDQLRQIFDLTWK